MQISIDDLELECWDCRGVGKVRYPDGDDVCCNKCGGKGVVLTALGQTLLSFVKRHLS